MSILKIGLTGGMGCGKTTVSNLFADFGIPVIDADTIARQLAEPGEEALAIIFDQFGNELKLPDGRLDRTKLRDIVFADSNKREQLESILHPRIDQKMEEMSQNLSTAYCIFSIPLLVEKEKQSMVDRILVIDTPVELQYKRTEQRDGLSRDQIAATLATQASREERLAAADDIITNDADLDYLSQQVKELHHFYLELANKG